MRYCVSYGCIALVLSVLAIARGGGWLWCCWPAFNAAIISAAYAARWPGVFRKSRSGRIPVSNWLVLLPFLFFQHLVWHFQRLVSRQPPFHRINDQLLIGRRLLSHEIPEEVKYVVDLTCEFSEPVGLRSREYHCLGILDGDAPEPETLRDWCEQIRRFSGTVYIHCAAGHGRTGLVVAALLLLTEQVATPADAIRVAQSQRPGISLNSRQRKVLSEFSILD